MKMYEPITGKPNMMDDDTVNRGISGQSLREKQMDYDPATGKRTGGYDVNLGMNNEIDEDYDDKDDM